LPPWFPALRLSQHFDFPQSPARLDAGRSADNISSRIRRSIEGLPRFIFRFVCGPLKQHLAAIRMLFDWLVTGNVIEANPAHSVRGPRYTVKKGKTPVLTAEEAHALLESIPITKKAANDTEATDQPDLSRAARPRFDRDDGL
jgi:hypothetical protein